MYRMLTVGIIFLTLEIYFALFFSKTLSHIFSNHAYMYLSNLFYNNKTIRCIYVVIIYIDHHLLSEL